MSFSTPSIFIPSENHPLGCVGAHELNRVLNPFTVLRQYFVEGVFVPQDLTQDTMLSDPPELDRRKQSDNSLLILGDTVANVVFAVQLADPVEKRFDFPVDLVEDGIQVFAGGSPAMRVDRADVEVEELDSVKLAIVVLGFFALVQPGLDVHC